MSVRTALKGASARSDDNRLARGVRAELGRVSSHPDAIDVQVNHGIVTLRGQVLNAEVSDILNQVESVRGVRCVQYEFDGYSSASSIPCPHESDESSVEASSRWPHRWGHAARTAATAGLVATGAWAVMRARA